MPVFEYQAINRSGKTIQGQIEAIDRDSAMSALAESGAFVNQIVSTLHGPDAPAALKSDSRSPLRLPERLRVEFISQLATALSAQLPLLEALQVVGQQNPHHHVKELAAGLVNILRSGRSLSQAMAHFSRIFDQLHVSMVQVGETSGQLDQSMTQLANLTEREMQARTDITTASLYPFFVLCLGVISLAIVVTWILPQILETMSADLAVLPWPTRAVMTISRFFRHYGWILIIITAAAVGIIGRCRHLPLARRLADTLKLQLPVLGPIQKKWAVSRFARTLGTLIRGGIPILDALNIVRNTLGNEVLARQVDRVAQQVRTGSTLAEPLRKSGFFPPLLIQIVAVGEQTGQLDSLLLNAAHAFDKETNVAIKRFMAVFPAVLILILALIVGFIVAATLLPIVQLETGVPGMRPIGL